MMFLARVCCWVTLLYVLDIRATLAIMGLHLLVSYEIEKCSQEKTR